VTLYDIDTRGQVSVLFQTSIIRTICARREYLHDPDTELSYDLIVEGRKGLNMWMPWRQQIRIINGNIIAANRNGCAIGVKGRSVNREPSQNIKQCGISKSSQELGTQGEQSLARNFSLSSQLREDIKAKIITVRA
jgi:hypothetical protein